MGKYMLKRIIKSRSFPKASLLHQFGGYDNTASVSFMEGQVNQHMLDVYGHYRLEFNLRNLGIGALAGGLIDCEYVPENALKEYADEYCKVMCSTYESILLLQEKYGKVSPYVFGYIEGFITMELDIIGKVLGLKEQKWSEEKEWRRVFELNEDSEIHYYRGKPYVKFYLDKHLLTGITVFYTDDRFTEAQNAADDILKYISERGYKSTVRVEAYNQRIQ